MLLVTFLLLNTNEVNVAASPETPYFFVDPSVRSNILVGGTFDVGINVSDAPPTYAWDVIVYWDPSVLELFYKSEGDFLKRGTYVTTFTTYPLTPPWDQVNANGNITIGCSLYGGDVPWASGSGELFRLGFRVKATGSTLINLFGTVLLDHLEAGSPAPTPYSNLDCFFFNEQFHDIAVTGIIASPTEVRAEEPVSINVDLENEGNFTEGPFDVAVYADVVAYNSTHPDEIAVGDEIIVGTQTVASLASGATTTLSFTWNTTGVEDGNYTISARSLLLDDDTRDNVFIDGEVTVKPPLLLHDIAIISVAPSSTEAVAGDQVAINIEVKNEGNFNETFDVTAYADLDAIVTGDEIVVGTQTGVALTNGTSTTLALTWDTTGVSEGTYTISVKVPPVEGEREADKADNTKVDGTVRVQGAGGPDVLVYAAVGIIIIIIVVVIVIYFFRFRKR